MRTQPAASRQPTMPRLAFNRKDTGWRIDWPGNVPAAPTPPQNAFSVAVSWPAAAVARSRFTQSWLHRLIIRPATALRRNPGDIAIRILHVAGFAVDAILGVDDKARSGRLLD